MRLSAAVCLVLTACSFTPSPGDDPDGNGADQASDPDPDPDPGTWWDAAFARRVRIAIDNRGRDEDLRDFPVAVILDGQRVPYGEVRADGGDIRFVDADNATELAYEIERWDPGGTSVLWVRVPLVAADSADDHIYLYYGDPDAERQDDPAGVWSPGAHLAVYHLADPLTPGDDAIVDSSGNGRDGSDEDSLAAPHQVTGWLAGSIDFAPAAARVSLPDPAAFTVEVDRVRTLEAWFRAVDTDRDQTILYQESSCRGWSLSVLSDGLLRAGLGTTATPGYDCGDNGFEYAYCYASGGPVYEDGRWHYAAVIIDRPGGTMTLHVDGGPGAQRTIENTRFAAADIPANIGYGLDGGRAFTGHIDEVRITDGARSAAWIAAQHASMTDALLDFGAPESH